MQQVPRGDYALFMGSGTSEGVPRVSCLTDPRPAAQRCTVCTDAMQPGSRNRRGNTCLLLRIAADPDAEQRTIVIDVGKTFWEAAMTMFPRFGLREIDAVLLTHEHFDAVGGLDNLRDWARTEPHRSPNPDAPPASPPLPVHCQPKVLQYVRRAFPYLVDPSTSSAGGGIPSLAWHAMSSDEPRSALDVAGDIRVTPLPVHHGTLAGQPFICLGFRVRDFAYISDASKIPEETRSLLHGCTTLVLDALNDSTPHPSHLSIDQAVAEAQMLEPPPHTLILTGMCHSIDHDAVSQRLNEITERVGFTVILAYDGMVVPLPHHSHRMG